MINSNQLSPGMTLSLEGVIYRVESAVKVTVAKGNPFIKVKLKNLMTEDIVEKNIKLGQMLEDVAVEEKKLEFLYLEGKDYLFLDLTNLEQVLVPAKVVGDRVNFLKEGIEAKALFYGSAVFSLELPQFLELMIVKTDPPQLGASVANATKAAFLETGAKMQVPLFVDVGDIVKIDTITNEYVQRV